MSQNRRLYRAAAGALVLLAGTALGADGAARIGALHVGGVTITTDAPSALDAKAFDQKWQVIVLDGPMDPTRSAALTNAGVTLAGYLPTNAFIADLSKTTPAQVKALPFVLWATPFRKEWKLTATLSAGANGRPFDTPQRQAIAANGQVAAEVWLFTGEPEAPVRAAINKIKGAQVTHSTNISGRSVLEVLMQDKDVASLADMPAVQFAQHSPEFTARSNSVTRWVIQSDQLNMTPVYDHGITGVGQIAGLIDGGLGSQHCSFFDPANPIGPLHRKIVASTPNCSPFDQNCQSYTAPSYDFHGTHCSGTLLGDAGVPDDTRGIAYGAKLVFQYYPQPTQQSMFDEFMFAYNHGARVHSNSYGDDSSQLYDGPCVAIDTFQHDLEDNLIVFAVTDHNWAVRNPENAKNSLAVSASGEAPGEANYCFGGFAPTGDGRRKPEIMAPGCGIVSSIGSTGCATTALSGTSMACPAVAGAAVLVREYFMDGFYPTGQARQDHSFTPTGSLLKAMLINSAVDMTGIDGYPSLSEGWGRVLLSNVLNFGSDPTHHLLISDVRHVSGLQTGQTQHFSFYTGNCTQPLHITLAYADFPGQPHDNPPNPTAAEYVNNLDLVVTAPTGDVYRGNYFVNGSSAPGGTADAINNLEQVIIAAPTPGHWDVAIVGTQVQQGPQGYALVVTGAVDQNACASADFNCDGDTGTDADIEAFFTALAGGFGDADFNRDGDVGTDADIEAFFRVLAGGSC
jgi:subtilisin family serine protease